MSMSDPLGDMITRIRNGQSARKAVVSSPASRLRMNVLEVLKREGYIRDYSSVQVREGISELKIELKYHEGDPVISEIKRVSTPGRRVYSGIKNMTKVGLVLRFCLHRVVYCQITKHVLPMLAAKCCAKYSRGVRICLE